MEQDTPVQPEHAWPVAEVILAGTSAQGRGFDCPPPGQQAPATTTGFST